MLYTVLNPEDRYYLWQEYLTAIETLFNNIDDDLIYRFAPYGKPQDKDALNVQKLRDALEVLYDFTKTHSKELNSEFSTFDNERSNVQDCFNAWCYGLCPKVLKELRLSWLPDIENIAKFKQSEEISQEDTRQAVELWRKKETLQAV